jgi:GTPase involved in cell partitioning and DNA repair
MKIFHKQDGGIVQLIGKEKMKEWPIELPLIFIEYVRNNQLNTYDDSKLKKEIEQYLNEVVRDVAIPGLINVLDGDNFEETNKALIRIEELAKKNIEMVKPIKPYVENLLKKENKEVNKLCQSILENFNKAERKKKLAEKRKVMQEKEKEFLAGNIGGEEYAKARKEYLLLKE